VNANVPLRPALSCQVPDSVETVMLASTCTGAPLGAATMFNPMPTDPSGFWKAVPMTDAAWAVPH
jgi:hypothetical protein